MSKKLDSLGDRMKVYENCFRHYISKNSYVALRIDGKAFHTYTKGLERPFDSGLIEDMDATALYLCENVPGCKIGYVQSDEISLILTDTDTLETEPWFNNNIQKMVSISASMATAKFNQLRVARYGSDYKLALFDSRVFMLPNKTEVLNYLLWRTNDAVRNSIQSVGQSLYSHKELHGVSIKDMQELIFKKGKNWDKYDYRCKRGGSFTKNKPVLNGLNVRYSWEPVETPIFWPDYKGL
jgi:tRNA(His) guanylyltransferase